MFDSIRQWMQIPGNRQHPAKALLRFGRWKTICLFHRHRVPFKCWGDRKLFLYQDSDQSRMVLNNYWTECDEFKLIKDYVRPDDTLFDVGAQMGTYTIWMSKFITNGSIHSFEADPIQFLRLTENCQLNRLSHIKCNEMVLRDMEIESQFQSEVDEEEIPTKAEGLYTADAYCEKNEIDQVDYARVDMEGFEYFFLRGAMNLLQKKAIHIIQIEINGQVRHAGLSLDEVVAFIRATGYDLCRYDADGKRLYRCSYEEGIENYLLVADLHSANARIRENRKTSL